MSNEDDPMTYNFYPSPSKVISKDIGGGGGGHAEKKRQKVIKKWNENQKVWEKLGYQSAGTR
jgi:hypothetical protein